MLQIFEASPFSLKFIGGFLICTHCISMIILICLCRLLFVDASGLTCKGSYEIVGLEQLNLFAISFFLDLHSYGMNTILVFSPWNGYFDYPSIGSFFAFTVSYFTLFWTINPFIFPTIKIWIMTDLGISPSRSYHFCTTCAIATPSCRWLIQFSQFNHTIACRCLFSFSCDVYFMSFDLQALLDNKTSWGKARQRTYESKCMAPSCRCHFICCCTYWGW